MRRMYVRGCVRAFTKDVDGTRDVIREHVISYSW